ncbi:UNVERIFIED_ORG: hypothetical protein DFO82_2658 [Idiomarina abyssalis]|uniref:hypothetical protein n=1 Tax=unclassified Idiomarina TaxID=2614829 RepID=UPI000E2B561E|nr:hypothetical protein [Idiomarina sp. 017G]TDO45146.1 hypothetical protein DEU30_11432 [Idiomarina sp. 017G]
MASTSRAKLIKSIQENLRCPLDWEGRVEKGIFLQKWYYTVSDCLPNREQDAFSLKGVFADSYLPEPDEDILSSEFYDKQELHALSVNSKLHRCDCRNQYKAECQKHHRLEAQKPSERNKHYVLSAKTIEDIVRKSTEKNNVGLLLPNLSPEAQLRFYWAAISDIFVRLIFEQENIGEYSDRQVFENAWNVLMTREQFRICVDTMTTIGYYSGKEARWLIYDTTLSGGITHCYPALESLPNCYEATLDNLQGIKEAFIKGRSDWP